MLTSLKPHMDSLCKNYPLDPEILGSLNSFLNQPRFNESVSFFIENEVFDPIDFL
jgi:hypothetical protein